MVDVNFDAPDGCITGLLGPNGAGKTTTLRMLAALIAPDAGTMRVDGIDVVARPGDVLATRALRESLRWLRTPAGGSKCIVFSTHIMQEVERLCDSVVVVAHGRTVASGSVAELLQQTGESDFEEAFVKLAFAASAPARSAA